MLIFINKMLYYLVVVITKTHQYTEKQVLIKPKSK